MHFVVMEGRCGWSPAQKLTSPTLTPEHSGKSPPGALEWRAEARPRLAEALWTVKNQKGGGRQGQPLVKLQASVSPSADKDNAMKKINKVVCCGWFGGVFLTFYFILECN